MKNYFETKDEIDNGIQNFSQTPVGKRLKYSALIAIAIGCILIAVTIIVSEISAALMLFIRGCIGLCAIIFVILVAILVYKANKSMWDNRR